MKTRLSLKYNGASVDAGLMDVYQVASNMIAFSEFVVIASKITYGDKVEVKAEVSGFEQGSFISSLVFSIAGHAIPLFSSFSPSELTEIIDGSFKIWKHLKGNPPASVTQSDHQILNVENNDGQIIQVKTESFSLVINEKASGAAGQFVRKTLQESGIDSLEIGSDRKIIDSNTEVYYCVNP